jgi:small conductance mechanosensitive channel
MDPRQKRTLVLHTVINGVITAAGVAVLILFLFYMQTVAAQQQQKINSEAALTQIVSTLDSSAKSVETLTKRYNEMNQDSLMLVGDLFAYGKFDSLMTQTQAQRAETFAKIHASVDAEWLFVIDRDGTVQLTDTTEYLGKNLCTMGVLDAAQLAELQTVTATRKGTLETVSTTAADGTATAETACHPVTAALADYGITCNFYSQSILKPSGQQTGYYLVTANNAATLDNELATLKDTGRMLNSVNVGSTGFAFAVDSDTGTYTYFRHGDLDLTGTSAAQSGLQPAALANDYAGVQTIDGVSYYCVSVTYPSEVFGNTTVVVAVVPQAEINSSRTTIVLWAAIAFLTVAGLVLTYATILRNDLFVNGQSVDRVRLWKLRGKTYYFCRTISRRILPILMIGLLAIGGVSMYTQTLLALSKAASQSSAQLGDVTVILADGKQNAAAITEYYENQYTAKGRLAAYMLQEAPEAAYQYDTENEDVHPVVTENADGTRTPVLDAYGNQEYSAAHSAGLQKLCRHSGIDAIYVFDDSGRVMATSADEWYFALSTSADDQSYAFRAVLDGKVTSYVQAEQVSDVGVRSQYIGSVYYYYTCQDETGATLYVSESDYQQQRLGTWTGMPITRHRSLIQICVLPDRLGSITESTSLPYVLSNIHLANDGFMVAFSGDEDHTVLYSPVESSIGKKAADIGVSDAAFAGDYNGFQRANGVEYFQSFGYVNGSYVATAIPTAALYRARNGIALVTVLISALFILLLTAFITVSDDKLDELYRLANAERLSRGQPAPAPAAAAAAAGPQVINMQMPGGNTKRVKSAASRWDGVVVPWNHKTPEQKFALLLKGYLGLFVACLFLAVVATGSESETGSILTYVISGAWDKSFNIFALTSCGMLLLVIFVLTSVFKYVVNRLTKSMGARAETVGHLLESFVRYGGMIAGIFFSLYLLGLNAGSLLASAGILSIVVGLGAQSLISDILAGMFIVFEGEFRVGDIVTVGEFRGQVLEIGLRTTKIEDITQNIKIFNNSSITGVLNMTKEASYAFCEVGIEYGESIENVENVLKEEFPKIRKKLPAISDGPFYQGVTMLGDSSVNIRIMALCAEKDRMQLVRDLNREIYIAFARHNINIPFPQVVVSYKDTSEKTAVQPTAKQSRSATAFVEEQKKATRGMEDDGSEG